MITGMHAVIHSRDAEADRAFFRDVLGFSAADAGGGWLIFALPPSELACHPADDEVHEVFLLCDDVETTIAGLAARGVACAPVTEQSWGRLTRVTLPGGGTLGLYQPRHPRPQAAA